MAAGEVHAAGPADHGRLQGFGEVDEVFHARRGAAEAVGDQNRILRGHEHASGFGNGGGIADGRRELAELGDMQRQVIGNRILLQLGIGHQQHGQRGRGHGDLVGAHGGFGEVGERSGQVVPLDEVADHGGGVLNAVRPFHGGDALGGVDDIADDHVDGSAVAPGVINGHGGMLEPDGAVREYGDGLAFDLRVPVSHGHGGLFMAAGDEFGILVAAIVDDGFVQAAEARSGIGADVLDAQRLDDVDHEIGAGAAFGENFEAGWRADLRFRWNRRGRRNARRVAGFDLLSVRTRRISRDYRGADGGALQEAAAIHGAGRFPRVRGIVFGFTHGAPRGLRSRSKRRSSLYHKDVNRTMRRGRQSPARPGKERCRDEIEAQQR